MSTGHVVMKLAQLGFRFRLDGEEIKVRFEGSKIIDSEQVLPLLHILKNDYALSSEKVMAAEL
ncbi:MAG: hypothetical protein ACUVXF_10510, partial [Desulfobaccales bacterium]